MVRVLLLAVVLLYLAADTSADKRPYANKKKSEFIKFVCMFKPKHKINTIKTIYIN